MNRSKHTLILSAMVLALTTLHAQKPDPSILVKPEDFNKIIPRNIPAIRERMLRPYLVKVAAKDRFLAANKGNFEKLQVINQTALPLKWDWRDKDAVTPVKDQNPFGTCWAFSFVATVESAYLIQTGESLNLSEQDLINCGTRRNVAVCGEGNGKDLLSQGDIFNVNLKKTGIGEERYNPYLGDENKLKADKTPDCTKRCGPCNETKEQPWGIEVMEWMTTDANGKELGDYDYIPENVIKKKLMENGPIDICIWIPPNSKIFGLTKTDDMLDEKFTLTSGTPTTLETFSTNVSYLPKNFSSATSGFGGHLMLLIGWDDARNAWLVKNSWGTGWGNEGYCWIKYRSNFICSRRLAPCWVTPALPDFFTTAVWRKENQKEMQVYDWNYENFKRKYDDLWSQGWRLHLIKNTVKNNEVRYTAVWRKSNDSEIQVYGWAYEDFKKKYDELWPQGWRLKLLDNFVYNGKVLYTAVWQKAPADEIQVYGWSFEDYKKKYDELWPQGWRLKLLNNFVYNGKVLYTAVWKKSTENEYQVYGWSYQDFRKKYDEIWTKGWRLKMLNSYVVNDKVLYTAVFNQSTAPEVQVYTWPYADFRKKDAEMRKTGWSMVSLNVY